jgi:hypothetical protein
VSREQVCVFAIKNAFSPGPKEICFLLPLVTRSGELNIEKAKRRASVKRNYAKRRPDGKAGKRSRVGLPKTGGSPVKSAFHIMLMFNNPDLVFLQMHVAHVIAKPIFVAVFCLIEAGKVLKVEASFK